MVTCSRCGETKPAAAFSKGQRKCKPCRSEVQRERYQSDPAAHRIRQKAASARWYLAHKETARERAYAWRAANPLSFRLIKHRHRASKAGCEIRRVTERDLRRLIVRYGDRCAYCDGPWTDFDHVTPLHLGGRHSIGNIVPACSTCNRRKGRWILARFRYRT